jgi:hypothetical protein
VSGLHLPWSAEHVGETGFNPSNPVSAVRDARGIEVGIFAAAAAEDLVRIVGSHAGLMEATEAAYILLLCHMPSSVRLSSAGQQALCDLRDAIAAATGESSQAAQERCEAIAYSAALRAAGVGK